MEALPEVGFDRVKDDYKFIAFCARAMGRRPKLDEEIDLYFDKENIYLESDPLANNRYIKHTIS